MLKTIQIDKIYRNDTNKEGKPYKDKRGNPFKLVTITTKDKQGNSQRLSMCDYKELTADWVDGQMIEVDITKNGDFLNFALPSKTDLLEKRVQSLEDRLNALESKEKGSKNDSGLPWEK